MAKELSRRLPFRVALLLAVFLLIIVNGGGLYIYYVIAESLDTALSERLFAVGNTAGLYVELWGVSEALGDLSEDGSVPTDGIDEEVLSDFLEVLEPVSANLREIQEVNRLRRIVLLDYRGRIVMDTLDIGELGSIETFLAADRAEFEGALEGRPTATVVYSSGSDYYKRAYVPVIPLREESMGDASSPPVPLVLSLETDSSIYLRQTTFLRNQIVILGLFSLILGTIWVAMVYRIARKNITLERAAERSARAMEIGRMTAAVAHEIRNPLGIIQTNAESLLGAVTDPEIKGTAEDILEETERLSRIVRRFSLLSDLRGRDSSSEEDDHGTEAKDVSSILTRHVERFIKSCPNVEIDLDPGKDCEGLKIPLSSEETDSVFSNILQNAAESIEGTGRIFVKLRGQEDRIQITFEDTGMGMTAEEVESALMPFHTTKAGGMGIGLPMAKSLVERVGGTLGIESRKGKGTKVTVYIPKR